MYIARPELGTKRLCVRCAVRFYDLCRQPPHCPACEADQPPPAPRTRAVPRPAGTRWQARSAPREDPAEAAGAVPLLETADAVEEDAEEDEDTDAREAGDDLEEGAAQ